MMFIYLIGLSLLFVLYVVAGGLTYHEISMQLSDGWTCFRGTNPNDPEGDCSNAAYLLMTYIVVNFVCNIIMLVITKHGSAVLLVVSQVCPYVKCDLLCILERNTNMKCENVRYCVKSYVLFS